MTARVKITDVEGRRLTFELEARDGIDLISKGSHERFIINRTKFIEKAKQKASKAGK